MMQVPDDDDALLAELREIVERVDPVPAGVVTAAKGAYSWCSVDEELALLAFDSVLEPTLAGTRGPGDRQLTFETGDVAIELDIVDGGRRIVGQVIPPRPGTVQLSFNGSTAATIRTDPTGLFSADGGAGSFRVSFRDDAGTTVVTEWVTL